MRSVNTDGESTAKVAGMSNGAPADVGLLAVSGRASPTTRSAGRHPPVRRFGWRRREFRPWSGRGGRANDVRMHAWPRRRWVRFGVVDLNADPVWESRRPFPGRFYSAGCCDDGSACPILQRHSSAPPSMHASARPSLRRSRTSPIPSPPTWSGWPPPTGGWRTRHTNPTRPSACSGTPRVCARPSRF